MFRKIVLRWLRNVCTPSYTEPPRYPRKQMSRKIQQRITSGTAGVEDNAGLLPRPRAGSLVSRSAALDWVPDGATGFSYKQLFEDPSSGLSTLLMKVEAGAEADPHAHEQLEQVYVLEGEFYDEHRIYGPGDFVVRAPGEIHTGGSMRGALVLLFYSD